MRRIVGGAVREDLRVGDLVIDEYETAVVTGRDLANGFYMNVALEWRQFAGAVRWRVKGEEKRRVVR